MTRDGQPVHITHFSDILCIWAYIAEARIEAVKRRFGDQVELEHRFCSVFGDTAERIGKGWAARGGYQGFGAHVREAAAGFEHVEVHPDLWLTVRPPTSASAHLMLEAVQLAEQAGELAEVAADEAGASVLERAAHAFRHAFFAEGRDIAARAVQLEVLGSLGLPRAPIDRRIDSGEAFAALATDYQDQQKLGVAGSPTLLLNQGRQKLFGNLGYRVIETNILELLRAPALDAASWC
jgi:predicted DsbA family dithiol-disulfide isomerase